MHAGKYDYYYLIICSRGRGSETVTLQKYKRGTKSSYAFKDLGDINEEQFAKYGVADVDAPHADEGPVIAVPKGTMPLKNIYNWLLFDQQRQLEWDPDPNQAEFSALFRVFSSTNTGGLTESIWTSTNAWRNLECEIPSRAQFESWMDATDQSGYQLGQWDCRVMKEASKRYMAGTLTDKPFKGC